MFWTYTLSDFADFDDFSSDKSIVSVTTTKGLHGALILTILLLGNPFVVQSSDSCVASSDLPDFADFFSVWSSDLPDFADFFLFDRLIYMMLMF